MDTVLIADSLARLQVYDEVLFSALANALRLHLDAGEVKMREVRHATTAFATVGFVDARFSIAVCEWLMPRISSCSPIVDAQSRVYGYARRPFSVS